MKILATNPRATFDYQIEETFEAGLVLFGHEVKSAKAGHVSIKSAYVIFKQSELYLINAHIAPYSKAGPLPDYDPDRPRKLLLHGAQVKRLIGTLQQKGLTLIPLKMYTINRFIKLSFALAKGKKKFDKREQIKKRDVERELRTHAKYGD